MFTELVKGYVFADFFLNYRSKTTGLTLVDYVSLTEYLRHASHYSIEDVQRVDGLMYDTRSLYALLAEARGDLFEAISSDAKYQCRITLEDVYLMITAAYEEHLKPTLLWDQLRPELASLCFQAQRTQELVMFLVDFGTLVVMSPVLPPLRDWFVSTVELETSGEDRKSFLGYWRQMDRRGLDTVAQDRFRERLRDWFKIEFDRFDTWRGAVMREQRDRQINTGYHTQLPIIGFSDGVIMAAQNPARMAAIFIDTVKNWYTASSFEYVC